MPVKAMSSSSGVGLQRQHRLPDLPLTAAPDDLAGDGLLLLLVVLGLLPESPNETDFRAVRWLVCRGVCPLVAAFTAPGTNRSAHQQMSITVQCDESADQLAQGRSATSGPRPRRPLNKPGLGEAVGVGDGGGVLRGRREALGHSAWLDCEVAFSVDG
jgi:hypothetical protein